MKELIEIQKNLKAPKNQKNNFGGYMYRSCEDILEAVKPLLSERGCSLILTDEIHEAGGRVYVKAVARFFAPGNQPVEVCAFAREEETKKGMDAAQITGAASSYARKYALNGLFCIDDNKDFDEPKHSNNDNKNYGNEDDQIRINPIIIAIDQVNQSKTTEEMKRIWEANKEHDTSQVLRKAIINRQKQLDNEKVS